MNLLEIKPDLKTPRTEISPTVQQECRQAWKREPHNCYSFLAYLLLYFSFAASVNSSDYEALLKNR